MDGIRDDHGNHYFSNSEKRGQITSSLQTVDKLDENRVCLFFMSCTIGR
jgi:hypothetical protein